MEFSKINLLKNGLCCLSVNLSEWDRCENKTVERKAPKRCTFSPDDPKTSMELICSLEMRIAKGAFSLHSLFGVFLLLGK